MICSNLSCRGRRTWIVAAAVAAVPILIVAAGAVMYVNADSLDIKDRNLSVSNTIATVERSTPLQVVARKGNWVQVSVNGRQGWVSANALSEKPSGKKGQGVAVGKIKGGTIPQLESAAAVKGVGEGAEQYARAKNQRTDGLRELIDRSEAVTPDEFLAFLREGGLAGAQAAAEGLDTPATPSAVTAVETE